jgi:glycosyltransferase involved in cell wall biosynthesis
LTTLVVTSYAPALGTGRGMRTFGIVRALAMLGPVTVLHGRFGGGTPSPEFLAIDGTRYHAPPTPARPLRALTMARAVLGGVPVPVARGVLANLGTEAERLAAPGWRVVADEPMAAVALASLSRRRPVVYSAHNLESAFRTDWGRPERVRAFERRLLERSAETWMPSRADLEGACSLAPGARLRLVPNVVDVTAIEPVAATARTRRVLMVGDFTYAPNREGLDFLFSDVMPAVWALDGTVELAVAGRGLESVPWPRDARARRLGFVDDLRAAYADAGCAVVPLLRGGGSPLKFVEALAHGIPVVATPRAAAGLEARSGEHYLEGADATALARAVLDALGDRGGALATAGRALAEREYSIEALARRLAE